MFRTILALVTYRHTMAYPLLLLVARERKKEKGALGGTKTEQSEMLIINPRNH